MRHVDVKDKIPELVAEHAPWASFVKLGNLTKLRQAADGSFHHANYASGLLLYTLVKHFRPTQILEIGTGRGYGAFCMAMALRDCQIDGRIITLDIKKYTQKQKWAIERDGHPPRVESLSLKDVWEKEIDEDLRHYVELHDAAPATKSMAKLRQAGNFRPQLIYIDGDHTLVGARHDLYATLLMAEHPFRILMDDYTPKNDLYGVRRLVDEQLAPVFELEAIYNDRRWYTEPFADTPLVRSNYAQVLVDSEKTTGNWEAVLPEKHLQSVVNGYRKWGAISRFLEYRLYNTRKRLGRLKEQ